MRLEEFLKEIALSEGEYRLIVEKLGREPNILELGMFGGLWSEHCGYKHSKPLLKMLPKGGKNVLVKAGEENAGAIDIGDGLAVVMKMESHNHPSAIEPFHGAATGIGGIVRDIFTMGAFPIALMNSLRFGPLKEARNRYLFNGVISGIAFYGNCLGIPNIGGEIFFSPAYNYNPLVNVLCLGIVPKNKIVRSQAKGEGCLLMLVGAETGRDGLHGASGLASRTFEGERELRTAVQVGNPFMEKLLIEACLELVERDLVMAIQDLGAAGLTAASIESAGRGGSGVEIDVLKVPRRDEGMNPYEVMLAESQERMLIIPKPGCENEVKEVFEKWDLPCSVIGKVTSDGIARIKEGENIVAEVPVSLLTNPPIYKYKVKKPDYLKKLQSFDLNSIPDLSPKDCPSIFLRLLSSPNIASRELVYRQYDYQVQINTVIPPGGDAALLRIKGTNKGLALSTDGNGRYCYLDPATGGEIAVAEAARNVVCVGANPIALTNCLNLGNPEKPEIYYQLKEVIKGIARACRILNIPVISGNVSLYNETEGKAVYPTPIVGMLGIIEDISLRLTHDFKAEGDIVFLIGEGEGGLGGSEYLELIHGLVAGRPLIDLKLEARIQSFLLQAIKMRLLHSAHDISDGGLIVALAESCIAGGWGFNFDGEIEGRLDTFLFGEAPSRVIVSLAPKDEERILSLAQEYQVPIKRLGKVIKERFIIPGLIDLPLYQIEKAWRGGLAEALL